MRKVLRNKKGETLVETLIAILIFTMASIILYSMVTSAAKLNREAKAFDESMMEGMNAVEMESGALTASSGTVTISVVTGKNAEGVDICETATVPVDIFKDESTGLTSFRKQK